MPEKFDFNKIENFVDAETMVDKQKKFEKLSEKIENSADTKILSNNKQEDDLTKKLSKVVLHVAKRGRQSLFEKMTAANAEKIAEFMKKKPIFYENKEKALHRIFLDSEIASAFPRDFFKNPTKWIESQENIKRLESLIIDDFPTGETISELMGKPYDISRVKEFVVDSIKGKTGIVSKRLDQKQLEEIALARRVWESGISTPKVLGEIIDRGNFYVFFEKIPSINILALYKMKKFDVAYFQDITYFEDENDFLRITKEAHFGKFLIDYNKLISLWKKERGNIVIKKILFFLKRFYFKIFINRHIDRHSSMIRKDYDNNELLKTKNKLENELLEMINQFSDNEINKSLQILGFSNLEEYFNFVYSKTDENENENMFYEKDELEKIEIFFKEKTKDLNDKLEKNLFNKVKNEIQKQLFGFNVDKKISDLKKMCADKGIEHKDFKDRNILIEWDFDKNKPLIRKGEIEPKLFIVDWEPKLETPSVKNNKKE